MTLDLVMVLHVWYQKHRQQKKKEDKLDFIQIKNFYTLKDTIKKVKQPT